MVPVALRLQLCAEGGGTRSLQDLFNGGWLPYDGLHLSSPALNAALKAQETAKAVCEFQRLLDTAQQLVLRFSKIGSRSV